MKILVIEDEPGLQLGLTDLFEEAGYKVRVCGEGRMAMEYATSFSPDLVVLDLGLPDVDGTMLLEHFSNHHPGLPVMVLTARANESDIVLGFKMGAYDYVTKPFSPRILLARVESMLRRQQAPEKEVQLGSVVLNFERYEAFRNGEPLHLTTREIDLLKYLHQFEGRPVSRNDILDEVWGMDSEAGSRTVDTHIAMLRKKIEPNPDSPRFILSQRGIGYKMVIR